MALFHFKKKKQPKVSVEMYGYENGKRVELKEEKNPDPPKPMSYFQTIEREIKPLENAMVGFAVASKKQQKTDDRIAILKALVEAYDSLEAKCRSLGPDYIKYFSKSWEHCHNARNPDFCYIDPYKEELEQLLANRDELVALEERHEAEEAGLEGRVLAVLKENPAILQTEVYKHFDPVVKSDIQSILYFMEKDGVISRTKSGRTYEIKFL